VPVYNWPTITFAVCLYLAYILTGEVASFGKSISGTAAYPDKTKLSCLCQRENMIGVS